MRLLTRILAGLGVLAAAVVLAPAAMASATPTMSLSQQGNSAGAFHNLGLTLSFADSGTDSPRTLTLQLPPGLLANAAQNGGGCLRSNETPSSACEIGSGTVTVHPDVTLTSVLGLPVPVPASVPISVAFYLVPPPAAGDLAGIEVYGLGQQIGQTGQIEIRPSGSADGVGATVALTLPDTLPASSLPAPISTLLSGAVGISITEIQSTFDSLRYPATCPRSPAPFIVSTTSYAGSADTVSQGLPVTGCLALPYDPKFSASMTKDTGDDSVAVSTDITQASDEAPNRSVSLVFPTNVLAPDLRALTTLCLGSLGDCTSVGSVTASSPLYPTPLSGSAYLTGTSSGLTLTLSFPSPFPLTLVGTISLTTDTATFSGLPDIPLTGLLVKLNGGDRGLFASGCNPSSGTARAALSDQNGDRSQTDSSAFSVVNCPGVRPGGGSGSGGSGSGSSGGSGSGAGTSVSSTTPSAWNAGTHLVAQPIAGLAKGRPALRFTVSVRRHMAKFTRLTVSLPAGLSLRTHREHHRLVVKGVTVSGAKVRSIRVSRGRLVITLRRATRRATVSLRTAALRESRGLQALAEHRRLKRLRLRVAVLNTHHRTRTLTVTVRRFTL